jgi:hypothetical protein
LREGGGSTYTSMVNHKLLLVTVSSEFPQYNRKQHINKQNLNFRSNYFILIVAFNFKQLIK